MAPNFGTIEKIRIEKNSLEKFPGDDVMMEFEMDGKFAKIQKIFEATEHDSEVASILFLHNIPEKWNPEIRKQEKFLKNLYEKFEKIEPNFRVDSLIADEKNLIPAFKNNPDLSYFNQLSSGTEQRVDLRNWYTLTIDGADAKDLDDAISIAKYDDGNFLLGVHIADVSHFVTEKSPIDHEARTRGTSIYLPQKVIPMLPETLSNHLCSLTPETEKKTLTCLMKIDKKSGKMLHTDIFESLIQSQHRGEYGKIFENFQKKSFENTLLENTIFSAFELFEIIKKRRKKEGKISFETTELYFDFEKNSHTPIGIRKRDRNDAHRLIEEFMVLANEEVAKWCTKRKIPFLSRVHDEPNDEGIQILENILGKNRKKSEKILPKHIAEYLEKLDESARYHASRLILPKMSKAIYSHNRSGHFGLALDFYSHFTSPIRRYPDLATHRAIKQYLAKKLDEKNKKSLTKFLEKTAKIATLTEKRAEMIENSVDKIYILRFMEAHIGGIFDGKISGVTDWGIFVELDMGVEILVYLPRFHDFQVDNVVGAIIDRNQKIIFQIGEKKTIKIKKILKEDGKIVGEFIKK